MADKPKHSLWLRPFGETAFSLEQRIKELSKKYNSPSFEPHVTLLSGLTYGETELIQLTDTLAKSLQHFDILLTKAGYRDQYYQSLFVHVKRNSNLIVARRTAEQLFGCKLEVEFLPHLSLMYGDFPQEEKERILNTIGREFHLRFPVHSLLLVKTEGLPQEWEKIHASEFSKGG